jgi:hypothetical protein
MESVVRNKVHELDETAAETSQERQTGPLPGEQPGADFVPPFATLTWPQWLELQERASKCLAHFLLAVTEKRAGQALLLGLEMQDIATQLMLEVYTLAADLDLPDVVEAGGSAYMSLARRDEPAAQTRSL